jgi:RND superfamily putative drug exporter
VSAWQRLVSFPAGRVGKWIVLAVWLVIAAVVFPLAAKLSSAQNNDTKAWLPHNAESTRAYDVATGHFAGSDTLAAVVVYHRAGGLTAADHGKIDADRGAYGRYAAGPVGPVVTAPDRTTALVSVPVKTTANDIDKFSDDLKRIRHVSEARAPAGLTVKITGPAGGLGDLLDSFSGLDSTLLIVTVGVVAVLLFLTYRSPVLWLVPLLVVGIGSQLASALVYVLAKHAGLTVNGQSASILTVLAFGAGTDYALLLIARYREELHRHADRHVAMAVALRRSFPAVLASAVTVSLGLLCLLAAELNSNRGLGPVGALAIVATFLAMATLLPALLVASGRWLFWPFVPHHTVAHAHDDPVTQHGIWGRVARTVGRRPRLVWVSTALVLAAVAFAATGMRTGLTQQDTFTHTVDSVTGQKILSAHFPAGQSAPADVYARAAAADRVLAAARGTHGVSRADRVESGGGWVHVQAVLADPPDSRAAERTVARLRTATHAVPGSGALVTGSTAINLDVHRAVVHDEKVIMPLILAVVFVVLVLLLGALVAPLLLMASVVLSFLAALGVATLLFRALGHPRIDASLPLVGFLFLVALGVDYTIFLMTRAKEEVGRHGHRTGVLRSLAVTGGVITSAGLVLAATFSVLGVLPLVTAMQMGLLIALGVLLDTLIVRSLLVPALALDAGRRIWWPGRLARRTAVPAADRPLSRV